MSICIVELQVFAAFMLGLIVICGIEVMSSHRGSEFYGRDNGCSFAVGRDSMGGGNQEK